MVERNVNQNSSQLWGENLWLFFYVEKHFILFYWSIFFVPFFLIFWAIVVTAFTHHFLSWNIMQIYLDIHWTWRNEYTFCYLWGHWMVFNLLDGILHLKCATEVLGFKRFRVVITTLWEYELQLSIFFFFASQETRNGYTDVCSEYLENLNCLLWSVEQSLRDD